MIWLKRIGFVVAGVTSLLAALVVYVTVLVDPNDFKEELQAVALDSADVRLRLDGDIQWSFFPWLGLELADVGVAYGMDDEILRFNQVEFGLAILPLLSKNIQVDTVRLVGLTANLQVDAQGQPNWQPAPSKGASSTTELAKTAPSSSAEQTRPVTPTESADNEVSVQIPNINLQQLIIENAQIEYRDVPQDLLAKLTVNLELTDVQWDQSWPMLLAVSVAQSRLNGESAMTADVELGANLTVFPERQVLSLEKLAIKASAMAEFLPVSPLAANLSIEKLDADLPQENLFIKGFALSSLGANLSGDFNAVEVMTAPSFDGKVSIGQFNPRALLKQLSIELPAMQDETALTQFSADLSFSGSADQIQVKPLSLKLDETLIEANATVDLSPVYWDIEVNGRDLNVDRYLPPKTEAPETAQLTNPPDAVETPETDLFPVDMIRGLNGKISFSWDNLQVMNLAIDQVLLNSTQANGVIDIKPFNANLYQGNVNLTARLDARKAAPIIQIQPMIEGVQIQPLLKDFADLDLIAGATFLQGDMRLQGNQVTPLLGSLTGDLLVEVKQGALVGVNLTKSVCEGIASTNQQSLSASNWTEDTPFETFKFPARMLNGEVSTPGLKITAVGLNVTGDGRISLPNKSLNYQTNVGFGGSQLDSACDVSSEVAKLTFPIVCKGLFSDPPAGLCRPDIGGFARLFGNLAQAELDAALAVEKAKAQAALAAEKARVQAQLDAEKAKAEAALAEEKARLQAELAAKKKAEEAAAKKKLEDSFKKELKNMF